MVNAAMAWARSKGLSRRSEVHGKDEFRVPTDFSFKNSNVDRTTTKLSANFQMEARCFLVVLIQITKFLPPGCMWAAGGPFGGPDTGVADIDASQNTHTHTYIIYIYT